ncbi:hypothetical protein EV359DRAFT_67781 [Lentinula novae-zelandiae]|nr:hypothetical protein EV359DRAFT_67781 [Lentinula novae-zelandiae]
MPAFSDGRTSELLETEKPTVARKEGEKDDWAYFYVGIFVDRDMFMRYFPGGGVGHVANWKFFKQGEDSTNDNDISSISSDLGADELDVLDTEEISLEEMSEDGSDDGSDDDLGDEQGDSNDDDDDDLDVGGDDWQWDDGYGSP